MWSCTQSLNKDVKHISRPASDTMLHVSPSPVYLYVGPNFLLELHHQNMIRGLQTSTNSVYMQLLCISKICLWRDRTELWIFCHMLNKTANSFWLYLWNTWWWWGFFFLQHSRQNIYVTMQNIDFQPHVDIEVLLRYRRLTEASYVKWGMWLTTGPVLQRSLFLGLAGRSHLLHSLLHHRVPL